VTRRGHALPVRLIMCRRVDRTCLSGMHLVGGKSGPPTPDMRHHGFEMCWDRSSVAVSHPLKLCRIGHDVFDELAIRMIVITNKPPQLSQELTMCRCLLVQEADSATVKQLSSIPAPPLNNSSEADLTVQYKPETAAEGAAAPLAAQVAAVATTALAAALLLSF
jgi:hypothetical protein